MRIKPFLLVLAIFLAAGGLTGSLTGLFTSSDTTGGMPTSAAPTNGRGEAARQQGSQSPQGDSGFDPQQIRERIQSGELTREDLANLREDPRYRLYQDRYQVLAKDLENLEDSEDLEDLEEFESTF